MDNAKIIWDFFEGKGLGDIACAGVLGNLYAESALNPKNLQNGYEKKLGMNDDTYTAAVDNGSYTNFVRDSAGYGLCQWTYWSRKQNLLDFARAAGKSIGDLSMQLDFLWKELNSYRGLTDMLRGAATVRAASDAILLNFEKPASVGPGATALQRENTCVKRAGYGQGYYDRFAGSAAAVVSRMKYHEGNAPLQCMLKTNPCYKKTYRMQVRGVLWHDTGCNNPNVKRYVQPCDDDPNREQLLNVLGVNKNGNDWGHTTKSVGVNAFIGKLADGTVAAVQTMPWDYAPWGCGSGKKGSCNDGWIQFEICQDSRTDKAYFDSVYKEAVELTAYLCRMYGVDPMGTVNYKGQTVPSILCHQDSYRLGLGSNHSDVYDWFDRYGKTMDDVRRDVAAILTNAQKAPQTQPPGNPEEEDEDMTQERFNELMRGYRATLQDNDSGTWSANAREWAVSTGLVQGSGEKVNGQDNMMWEDMLTREQAVQLFYRFAAMHGLV